MSWMCPRCGRSLTLGADPAEPPRFCMYCGHKLEGLSPPPGPNSGAAPKRPIVAAPAKPAPGSSTRSWQRDQLLAGSDGQTQAFLPGPPSRGADDGLADSGEAPTGTFSDLAPPAPPPGKVTSIAGYSFVRFLGAGGMGSVYEAESLSTGQRVAVKLLSNRLAANPSSVERFRQEGRVASQISHPRCVFVLRADTEAGRPFIVMELMPGRTLKDHVDERGPLPVAEALARILDVIDGLAEAHRLGVIHRDVKPSNCFLTDDDRVKIGDFGLSKSLTGHDDDPEGTSDPDGPAAGAQLTTSGAFLGTVMYASPEQIRGEPVGYDSDVYAVSGTLYYLLTGQAPFQHESLTASLAKAVSEPPPPIRPRRPDVPRELERVILCGLDRDRARRWPTLEALRDAVVALQAGNQQPARPRVVALAYVFDMVVQWLLAGLIDLTWNVALDPTPESVAVSLAPGPALSFGVFMAYFTLFEGLYGTTPGKRLLRLRVAAVGAIGPPGLRAAAVRAAAFEALWLPLTLLPILSPYLHPLGVAALTLLSVAGVAALFVQFFRTAHGWRGLHDFASGCRVVQRPRPPHRPWLVSRYPNPLDQLQSVAQPFPPVVGGFVVEGKLRDLPDGAEVWVADDRSLGRRVLLHVRRAGTDSDFDLSEVVSLRPTRLRIVGQGNVGWPAAGRAKTSTLRAWTAYVAPAGAPLLDLAAPEHRLAWADARPILEQLAEELSHPEPDGTPRHASVTQLWVEPNGRLQLVDFPLPRGRSGAKIAPQASALDLVRQAATLALEGEARTSGGRIQAPLPPHASEITDRLFADAGPPQALAALRDDLAANAASPAATTAGMRATHLGALIPLVATGLLCLYALAGLHLLALTFATANQAQTLTALSGMLADDARREAFRERVRGEAGERDRFKRVLELSESGRLPRTLAELDQAAAESRALDELYRGRLNRPERWLFDSFNPLMNEAIPAEELPVRRADSALRQLREAERQGDVDLLADGLFRGFFTVAGFYLAVWAALAFLLRGGFALTVAGLTHVREDGCRAGRLRLALRELIVWLPVLALLTLTLVMQHRWPQWVVLRTGVWLLALSLLPAYIGLALRYPARPPQDRLLGLRIVPK